jgi:putative endonuclease
VGLAGDRGRAAESLVAAYLELTGATIVERNPRLDGVEIDLIAAEGRVRVLVEVKCRSRADYGGAAAAIDAEKRRRLVRAARAALRAGATRVRIDVVTVDVTADGAAIRHYRDAIHG